MGVGLKLELYQKYVLIPLDNFVKYQHNRDIIERLDAWLTLPVCDEPERITALIEKYPEFRLIYKEDCEICRNTERVMEMFSKELYEPDRNMVQYMMDEQQETIDNMYKGTANILRSLNMSDNEIVLNLCAQYRIEEAEARNYLQREEL